MKQVRTHRLWCSLVLVMLAMASTIQAYNTPQMSGSYNTYSTYIYFNKVEVGNQVHTDTVTSGTTHYWDYTSHVFVAPQGQNISMKIHPGTTTSLYYPFYYRHYHVWIDWNQDGNFNETYGTSTNTGERYRAGSPSYYNYYYNITPIPLSIQVNPNIQLPGPTRMRIRMTSPETTSSIGTLSVFDNWQAPRYSSFNYVPCESQDYTLNIAFPPSLQAKTFPVTWEGTDMVKTAAPGITYGTQPFTYSIADVSNGAWVTINATTGEIGGAAPDVSADTVCSFEVTVLDAAGLSDSRVYTTTVRNALNIPLTENFDGTTNGKYVLNSGGENSTSFAAGQGMNTSTGVNIAGTVDTGWQVTTSIANNVNQWQNASARARTGYLEAFFEADQVSVAEVKFAYRIHNSSNAANAANLGVLVTENGGVTWTAVAGPLANSFGGYRTPTGGQFVNESVRFTVSGSQERIGVRIIGLVRNTAALTSVQVDNLEMFVPIQITNGSTLPQGTQHVPYTPVMLTAIGGLGTVTGWQAAVGSSLPNGLSIVQMGNDFYLQGIPETPAGGGFVVNFELQVNDSTGASATKQMNLTLLAPPADLTITTGATLASGTLGFAGAWQIEASGGLAPYTFSFADPDNVPTWMSISASGLITGTPNDPLADAATVAVKVVDSEERGVGLYQDSDTKLFTLPLTGRLTLDPAAYTVSPLISLPVAEVSRSYNRAIPLVGGTPPYTWSIVTGTLPDGMSLMAEDGSPFIFGAPLNGAHGSYVFTLRASDRIGYLPSDPNYSPDTPGVGTQDVDFTFRMNVGLAGTSSISILTSQSEIPENIIPMDPFEMWVSAVGGRPPYTFAPTGVGMPSWVTLSSTGRLSINSPAGVFGSFLVSFEVVDTASQRATKTLTVSVEEPYIMPQWVTAATLQTREIGESFSVSLDFEGGLPPYEMVLVNGEDQDGDGKFSGGGLPMGVTFNIATGRLAGLIDASNAPGTFTFDVSVIDAMGNPISRSFTMTVLPQVGNELTIISNSLPTAVVNQSYAVGLQAAGGIGSYTWQLKPGTLALPTGLVLTPFGIITGFPTVVSDGPVFVTLQVRDESNAVAELILGLEVLAEAVDAPSGETGGGTPVSTVSGAVEGSGAGCSMSGGRTGGWALLLALLALLVGGRVAATKRMN